MIYLLGIPLSMMNISRQMISVGLLCLATLIAVDKIPNTLKICLIGIITMTAYYFHNTVIVGVVLIIISGILAVGISKKGKLLIGIGLVGYLWSALLYLTNLGFDLMSFFSSNAVLSKYMYATEKTDFILTKSIFVSLFAIVVFTVCIIIGVWGELKNQSFITLFFLAALVVYAFLISSQVLWITERCGSYLLPFIAIGSINIASLLHSKLIKSVVLLGIVTLGVMSFTRTISNNYGEIIPYEGGITYYLNNRN